MQSEGGLSLTTYSLLIRDDCTPESSPLQMERYMETESREKNRDA